MRAELRDFYRLQFEWKRMLLPSLRAATDRNHPLHDVNLDLEHTDHVVHRLIEDLLSDGNLFSYEEICSLIARYQAIGSRISSARDTAVAEQFRRYVDRTLELLGAASALMQSSAQEPG